MTDEPQFIAPKFHEDRSGGLVIDSITLVDEPPHPSWRIIKVDGVELETETP